MYLKNILYARKTGIDIVSKMFFFFLCSTPSIELEKLFLYVNTYKEEFYLQALYTVVQHISVSTCSEFSMTILQFTAF